MENQEQKKPTGNSPVVVKVEKEVKGIFQSTRNKIIAVIVVAVIIMSGIGGLIYWNITSSRVYIEMHRYQQR